MLFSLVSLRVGGINGCLVAKLLPVRSALEDAETNLASRDLHDDLVGVGVVNLDAIDIPGDRFGHGNGTRIMSGHVAEV